MKCTCLDQGLPRPSMRRSSAASNTSLWKALITSELQETSGRTLLGGQRLHAACCTNGRPR